jgi:hypothetical protein
LYGYIGGETVSGFYGYSNREDMAVGFTPGALS